MSLRNEALILPTSVPSIATFTAPGVASPFDPSRSPTQAVAFWLRRDIVRGVFEPMERLKVEQLTQFYDIGHSPVREAILLLSGSGLVVHEHQKGHRVAPVSLADYHDVLDVYQRVYKLTLTTAVERGDDAWEEAVVVQLHRSLKVRKVLPDGAPEARELWQRAYGDLHRALLAGCGSPLLLQILRDLGGRLERYVNLFADLESDRERDHHSEHRQIVDALVARDAERLQFLIERYFAVGQPVRETIIEALKRREQGLGDPSAAANGGAKAAKPPAGGHGRPRKAPADAMA